MENFRRNERLVGVPRKDGTPYKLMADENLRKMMYEWIRGSDVGELCEKYHITRVQFHRQRYHADRILKRFVAKVRKLRDLGWNAKEIGAELDAPYEQINRVIIEML